jgi:branched-chain amino acid transport system ATP-binding protein
LNVQQGEIIAMIGGNGAGKSSIVRAVMGMIRPAAGTIHGAGGIDLLKLQPHEICKAGIALVPSERQVFREMTVRENLEMGSYCRTGREEIDKDLERVLSLFPLLRERFGSLAGNLSGGQQQQLAIGRALMARPSLLLMDEPSLGLAPVMVAQVFELLQKLNAEGLSILLIEQNAKRALEISHRAYVLRAGQLVAEGPSASLLDNHSIAEAYLGKFVKPAQVDIRPG